MGGPICGNVASFDVFASTNCGDTNPVPRTHHLFAQCTQPCHFGVQISQAAAQHSSAGSHGHTPVSRIVSSSLMSRSFAKLTWSLDHGGLPDWAARIGPSTLLIIDEAGMADTLTLDTAVQFAINRGANVRLVGDDQQLAAIGAGGVLRDIKQTHGALHLAELHRFTNPAEAAASLALREGKPEGLDFYLDHGRIHVADLAAIVEDAFSRLGFRPSRWTRRAHDRPHPAPRC